MSEGAVTVHSVEAELVEGATDAAAEMVQLALDEVKKTMGDVGISPGTLMLVVKYVMEAVEGKPVKGEAQKKLALAILKRLVEDSGMEESEKELCLSMIRSGVIGNTIDLVVDASRGNININQAANVTVGCIGACFQAFTSRRR